jgi:hypothetical protein
MSEIIKEHFADTSYNLAKALHFNKVSREYFDLLKVGAKGETKMLFQNCVNRLDWVYHNIYDRLSQNSRDILKKEMEDSLCFDEIMNKLVLLEPNQRATIESLITSLSKGETIQFVQEQNY